MKNTKFEPWNGRRVTEEKVEEWKRTAAEYLLGHPRELTYSILSGDTMVVAERHVYGIVVFDLLVRRTAVYPLEEDK